MANSNGRGRALKIGDKQLVLRGQLWPELTDADVWMRKKRDGFTTIPRGMPLILDIMNDLSKGQPLGSTYLELWCRAFDECFVTLSKPMELAFHSGFGGQRAVRTWQQRMQKLHDLGFINVQPGPSGAMSYAVIFNPYKVIQRLHAAKTPGLMPDKYNALMQRTIEIGADDLVEAPAPAKGALDDEIPF